MKDEKIIRENIILSLVFLVLLLITVKTTLGIFFMLITICPFIIVSYRNDFKMAIMVILINISISLIVFGLIGLAFTILAGSTGLIIGHLYKKQSILSALIAGVVVVLINIIIVLGINYVVYDTNLSETINDNLTISVDSLEEMLSTQFETEEQNELIKQYKDAVNMLVLLIPFMLISFSVLIVLTNHLLTRKILKIFDLTIPETKPFRDWILPRSIIYYYFIVIILVAIGTDIYVLEVISLNLLPILTIALIIQGLSFIFFYSNIKKINKFIPVLAVIVAFIPIMNQLIQILGMIDISFDFRKRLKS